MPNACAARIQSACLRAYECAPADRSAAACSPATDSPRRRRGELQLFLAALPHGTVQGAAAMQGQIVSASGRTRVRRLAPDCGVPPSDCPSACTLRTATMRDAEICRVPQSSGNAVQQKVRSTAVDPRCRIGAHCNRVLLMCKSQNSARGPIRRNRLTCPAVFYVRSCAFVVRLDVSL